MNNSIYITVRLDIEYDNMLEWNDVKNEVISETNFDFFYKRHLGDNEDNKVMVEIVNTQICGENE
jgi:hypothetical protein